MSQISKVLVSGASGFLGTQIVNQLLSSGYNVRALARGSKAAALKTAYADAGERLEVFEINDISHDTFPDAFVGVDALIHSASPLPDKGTPQDLFQGAVEGTLNIIDQAEKAGIKKVVVTSSITTVSNPQRSFTSNDWNPITKEEAFSGTLPKLAIYGASKKYAELALWEWSDAHPQVDVTTINPPFLYGAIAPQLQHLGQARPNDYSIFSTDATIAQLLFPTGTTATSRFFADIQDVAKLHVLALKSKPTSEVGRKRLVVANPEIVDWNEAVQILKKQRPDLEDRLTKVEAPEAPAALPNFDYDRVEEVLGFKRSDFTSFEQTLLGTVDSLIEVENGWKAKGVEIVHPEALYQ